MWIILAALCFSSVYDGLGAVKAIESLLVKTWDFDPWTILILMLFSFIIMGTFLDDTAMLVIVAPLYIPLVIKLGFNPIWFGVLYTVTCQIAYITPPFGYNLFLMRAMAPPEITLMDIYRSIVPFFFLMVLSMIILMIFLNLFATLILYVAAWLATAHPVPAIESAEDEAPEPEPAESRPGELTVSSTVAEKSMGVGLATGYTVGTATGIGLGALLAALLGWVAGRKD